MIKKFAFIILTGLFLATSAAMADQVDVAEVRRLLAESKSASGDYKGSIAEFNEVLKRDPSDAKAKAGLARALAGDRQYAASLALYDEILAGGDDLALRLEKARVLGWARRYEAALAEYNAILRSHPEPLVALEMNAKRAYWDNRIFQAIDLYREWIGKEPQNLEAQFDLSQIYSYQQLWSKARQTYQDILALAGTHWRAKEGLEKADLISRSPNIDTGYEFFEADSPSRDMDLKRHSFINRLYVPLSTELGFGADYTLRERLFSDFSNVTENKGGVRLDYRQSPAWRMDGSYHFVEYNRDVYTGHEFDTALTLRIFDRGEARFSYGRELLENNSTVIRDGTYQNEYKVRVDLDIHKRLKIGFDEFYAVYSDSNVAQKPGGDIEYIISFLPEELIVKYRYDFMNFSHQDSDYFSPQDFSVHALTVNWQHDLLNQEEFYGANRMYTDLGYRVQLDSTRIVMHRLSGAFVWDMSKRGQIRFEGQWVTSDRDIYTDKRAAVSAKVYF